MSTNLTLYVDQGTDWATIIDVTNFDGTPVNVAGYQFHGVVRKNPYSTLPSANLVITVAGSNANGVLSVAMNAATTANLEAGTYFYTITQETTANLTSVLQHGQLFINPSALEAQPTPQTVIFPQTYPNTSYFQTANSNQFA